MLSVDIVLDILASLIIFDSITCIQGYISYFLVALSHPPILFSTGLERAWRPDFQILKSLKKRRQTIRPDFGELRWLLSLLKFSTCIHII